MAKIHELLANSSQGPKSVTVNKGKKGKGKYNSKGHQVIVN